MDESGIGWVRVVVVLSVRWDWCWGYDWSLKFVGACWNFRDNVFEFGIKIGWQ